MRPTPRAIALFTLGIPVAILILAWRPALWSTSFAVSLLVLVAIGIDALIMVRRRQFEIIIVEPKRLAIGVAGSVIVDFVLVGFGLAGRQADLGVTALLEQTGPADFPVPVSGRTVEGRLRLVLPVHSMRRGIIDLVALWVRWRGPFGLVERRLRETLDRAIDVVPVARGLRGDALKFVSDDAQFGSKVQVQKGEGSEFETLQDHVAGLDNRFIDWKRSARHNKLLSKVFRTERNHQIVLAFDTGHLMLEPIEGITRLDHAIEAALTLAWVSLRSGDLVGAFAFDAKVAHYLAPAAGLAYLPRLQHSMARLQYHNEETNFTIGIAELTLRLKRRALVVLFTEFVDTVAAELLLESLQRIASRHAVIFVTLQDPLMTRLIGAEPDTFAAVAETVIAHDILRDRAIVLERIARMGIDTLDVPIGGLAYGLVRSYLAAKQRGRI